MASITADIIEQFVQKVDTTVSYSVTDLKKILSDTYKNVQMEKKKELAGDKDDKGEGKPRKQRVKRDRDENGDIIKKRAPSAYNLFIKEQSAKIKADNPDLDPKAVFKMAIDEWKKQKSAQDNDDTADIPANPPQIIEVVHAKSDHKSQQLQDEIIDTIPPVMKPKKARKAKKSTNVDDEM